MTTTTHDTRPAGEPDARWPPDEPVPFALTATARAALVGG